MMTANAGYPGSAYATTAGSTGFSAEATMIQKQIEEILETRNRAPSLSSGYRETVAQLAQIVADCAADDWDGDGGAALSPGSFASAKRFLEALPAGLQRPDVSLDPDGEVVFEWTSGPQHMFSISFGAGGKLSYAGLFGPSKTHGVEYITYGLPRELVAKIRRASRAR